MAKGLMVTAKFAARVKSFSPSSQVVRCRQRVDGSAREETEDTFWEVKDDRSSGEVALLKCNKL